ncbi:MAG: cytochrome c biogenesis protein CcsA [Burkholderiales bacterium]|nr:cytochrome c biogenesis protein CcsA [Burkholderiales bacterium]
MNFAALHADQVWLAAGALLALAALAFAWLGRGGTIATDLMLAALAAGIALRWARIGHGPFLSMYEVLASGMFTLGIAWRLAGWRVPLLRDGAPLVMSLIAVMGAWMLATDPGDTHLPATYEMSVLWFHVLLGKVFLGCALVATALAGVVLSRSTPPGHRRFSRMPGDATLDAYAWRFMLAALVFESLMLIAGAVWAQDAWGRYWAWDPLETWAFITWVALAAAVHARVAWRVTPRTGALMITGVFVIAFLTFFGVPFVTIAPHKGAV